MKSMSIGSLFVVIFICLRTASSEAGILIHNSTVSGARRIIMTKNIAGHDSLFIFAHCDEKKLSREINCTLTRTNLSLSSGRNVSDKVSDLKWTLSGTMTNLLPLQIDLLAHGNKTLISWVEYIHGTGSMKQYVVIKDMNSYNETKLAFSCYENYLATGVLMSNVVVYEHSFEVIVSDPRKCGQHKKCRITFNEEGVQLGDRVSFPSDHYVARTISASPESSAMGFFALAGYTTRRVPNDYPVELEYLPFSDSEPKLNLISTIEYNASLSSPIISNAHNLFTICGLKDRTLRCNQFKVGGKLPVLDESFDEADNVVAVHNFDKGGFLLLALQRKPDSNLTYSGFNVTKVGKDGKRIQVTKSQIEFSCSGRLDQVVAVVKDVGKSVCFTFACTNVDTKGQNGTQSRVIVLKDCLE